MRFLENFLCTHQIGKDKIRFSVGISGGKNSFGCCDSATKNLQKSCCGHFCRKFLDIALGLRENFSNLHASYSPNIFCLTNDLGKSFSLINFRETSLEAFTVEKELELTTTLHSFCTGNFWKSSAVSGRWKILCDHVAGSQGLAPFVFAWTRTRPRSPKGPRGAGPY